MPLKAEISQESRCRQEKGGEAPTQQGVLDAAGRELWCVMSVETKQGRQGEQEGGEPPGQERQQVQHVHIVAGFNSSLVPPPVLREPAASLRREFCGCCDGPASASA